MSILITGGAGFIGSHLVARLLEATEESLICFDNYQGAAGQHNLRTLPADPRLTWIKGDIRDASRLNRVFEHYKIKRVIHLAALAGVRESSRRPRDYYDTNVRGTHELLQACQQHRLKRFVFVSSSTVYGLHAPLPFDEDRLGEVPTSPYGVTKRAAELMVLQQHHLAGLPAVILRPFSVYGPRMRGDLALALFCEKMERGEPLSLFGDGTACRDYTHVSEICEGMLAALYRDGVAGQAINLGGGRPITLSNVIHRLENALGVSARVEQLPRQEVDLPATHASLQRAEALLGYQPSVTFEQGLGDYVDWFRNRRFPRLAASGSDPSQSGPSWTDDRQSRAS
ncbi:MAG: NAD-dependent epimerase/dehydratase family protein [Planctomycetota bacterium]